MSEYEVPAFSQGELAAVAARGAVLTPLGQEMVAELGVDASIAFGELTLTCRRDQIIAVLTDLRDRFWVPAAAGCVRRRLSGTGPSGSTWSITCCR